MEEQTENLTIEEAAKILRVSKATCWNRCKRGKLPAFKLPGSRRWLINRKDFEAYLRKIRKASYDN